MKKIVVVGSMNMDCVIETPRMPRIGETVLGTGVSLVPGGKGANQAYAIGRLGGQVVMLGAVGDDDFGMKLKANLESVGVVTDEIEVLTGQTTGQAFLHVDSQGDNAITVIPGTNAMLTKEMIDRHRHVLEACDIVIMQLEIPLDVVEYVKNIAVSLKKLVMIDPAPAVNKLPEEFWKGVDIIKPNETELEILAGRTLDTENEIKAAAKEMMEKGVGRVIVTLGGNGCLMMSKEEEVFFQANKVKVVDTTAAGDSFTAALVIALSEDRNYEEAITFAQEVSAVVVTKKGAQSSIPSREEVEKWRGQR